MKVLISKKTGNFYYWNGNGDYHCKEGFILEEDLNSGETTVINSKQREFFVFEGNNHDRFMKLKRGPQIITEKDLGYIIARSGIDKNSKVLEAGGGSGGASTFFGRICKEVKTYEIREEHCSIIEKNLKAFGLDNVELVNADLSEHIQEEKDVDLLFLDMPEPSMVLEKDLSAVKKGSYIICYVPSISQIQEITEVVYKRNDLYLEEITEVILRYWRVWEKISRPEGRKDIDHTAFLVFLRKC